MAHSDTIAAVVDFFQRYMQEQQSAQARAAWQERVQPRLADYAADLMQAAQPYSGTAQAEHTALMDLCG